MLLKKIISGGQTGADRAALDVAIELGIAHGGAIPKGRRAEDGVLDKKYLLVEMETISYPKRTEKNVMDADGTVIFSHGSLRGGSMLTANLAVKYKKPLLCLDVTKQSLDKAKTAVSRFLEREKIVILNVAGPRASGDPEIYKTVCEIMKAVVQSEIEKK